VNLKTKSDPSLTAAGGVGGGSGGGGEFATRNDELLMEIDEGVTRLQDASQQAVHDEVIAKLESGIKQLNGWRSLIEDTKA
jgi:hypothetical protein